jgi:hypothetical protein
MIYTLFGVILLFLGALNTMLSWRGGYAVLELPVLLLFAGLLLCVMGAFQRRNNS